MAALVWVQRLETRTDTVSHQKTNGTRRKIYLHLYCSHNSRKNTKKIHTTLTATTRENIPDFDVEKKNEKRFAFGCNIVRGMQLQLDRITYLHFFFLDSWALWKAEMPTTQPNKNIVGSWNDDKIGIVNNLLKNIFTEDCSTRHTETQHFYIIFFFFFRSLHISYVYTRICSSLLRKFLVKMWKFNTKIYYFG